MASYMEMLYMKQTVFYCLAICFSSFVSVIPVAAMGAGYTVLSNNEQDPSVMTLNDNKMLYDILYPDSVKEKVTKDEIARLFQQASKVGTYFGYYKTNYGSEWFQHIMPLVGSQYGVLYDSTLIPRNLVRPAGYFIQGKLYLIKEFYNRAKENVSIYGTKAFEAKNLSDVDATLCFLLKRYPDLVATTTDTL